MSRCVVACRPRFVLATLILAAAPAVQAGAIYSRFQDEDTGINDLGSITPSTSAVTLANGAALTGSIGAADCYADAGERQGSITMPDRAVLKDLGYPIDTIFKAGFAYD